MLHFCHGLGAWAVSWWSCFVLNGRQERCGGNINFVRCTSMESRQDIIRDNLQAFAQLTLRFDYIINCPDTWTMLLFMFWKWSSFCLIIVDNEPCYFWGYNPKPRGTSQFYTGSVICKIYLALAKISPVPNTNDAYCRFLCLAVTELSSPSSKIPLLCSILSSAAFAYV